MYKLKLLISPFCGLSNHLWFRQPVSRISVFLNDLGFESHINTN